MRSRGVGVVGPPLGLAAALVALTLLATSGAAPLYEASAHLQAAPVLLLHEFNAAVGEGEGPRTKLDDSLQRRDLGELELAARDARFEAARRTDVSFAVDLDSELGAIALTARSRSPQASADLANAFAQALVTRRNKRLAQRISDLRASLLMMRRLAAHNPAAQRKVANDSAELRRLLPLRGLSGGGVSIVRHAATPREAVAPRIVRNSLEAALLGILVGFTPAVAGTSWRRISRRIHSGLWLRVNVDRV